MNRMIANLNQFLELCL